ncbi:MULTISPECIES: DegT/DnrJ/EryC1/StrS family aminotransferase [Achromobacter]|uniref:DegT/DnrJ/EryC1/StrS family aminotransferase n=1 Tax=Achromobacter spanius TaxID=217203 RepID=A0ABY8GNU5_9BURK|nr:MULTISPECIES: DegT/DnrJ/EryC1/StrS family aminotransferase [Achromobacter]WAI84357.1 DegT/DnrJ/EryC1/StrS family aminotransferase [Achromobacter spanius]WEX94440.1 DegT/DnrJ/EryC1/StrS family aminotransferase [Achromobacter sp. SS2-2022]WFP06396.1 DegT/DnrJ/EryC1/StrS family aminotransferase [Achromobacter spanius]
MAVSFIDLRRFESGFQEAWQRQVAEMSARAEFIGGQSVSRLEERLREATGAREVVSCANGTDALQLALRAVGVGRDDIVLVPDLTFWATYEAVVNVNATPYTVDCNKADQSLDVDLVAELLGTVKPKAVIVVHLYGWGTARLAELRKLCRDAGVALIEDSAQAYGVKVDGDSIFKGAHIATTSFYPAKVLGAAGDGGAVFCEDKTLADTVRRLSNHGRTAHYGHGDVGWNSRLDSLQAAFLNLSLDHIDARLESRRASANLYREKLGNRFPSFTVADAPAGYEENGYCNVSFVDDLAVKARLEAALKEKQIGFGNIYPSPLSKQPGAAAYLKGQAGGETAAWLCSHVINLPLFPYMTDSEIAEVVDTVSAVLSA